MNDISLPTALGLSLLGIAVVFLMLALLFLVVLAMGKLMQARKEAAAPAAPAPQAPAADPDAGKVPAKGSLGKLDLHGVPPERAAMVMAIVADQLGEPLNTLRFISIRESEASI